MMQREANSSPNDSGSELDTDVRDRGISMALLFCVEEALRKEDESQKASLNGVKVFQNEPKLDDIKMDQDASPEASEHQVSTNTSPKSSPPATKRTRRVYLHERSIPEGWSIEGPFYDTDRTTYLWHASDGQIWPTFKSAEQYWTSKGEAIKEGMPAAWSGPPSAVSWTSWRDWRRREKAKTKSIDGLNLRFKRESNKRKRNSEDYDSGDNEETPKKRKEKIQSQKQFLSQQFINNQFCQLQSKQEISTAANGFEANEVQFWIQSRRAKDEVM